MQMYINKNNQQIGPFEETKVLEMLRDNQLSPNDFGIRQGENQWQKLGELYPNIVNQPIIKAETSPTPIKAETAPTVTKSEAAPKKSRTGLLLGCAGFFLITFLVVGVLGFLAYRNLYPSGTAGNLPEKIGYFKIENPQDLNTPKGNIWGTEKNLSLSINNQQIAMQLLS